MPDAQFFLDWGVGILIGIGLIAFLFGAMELFARGFCAAWRADINAQLVDQYKRGLRRTHY